MKVFPEIRINSKEAAHRQITSQLRGLITGGILKPGTRLPGIRELAKEIGSNYFTVQEALTPLVREGLIERKPKLGTVVLRNSPQLT
ncbi:MAG TPA: winged helix-turn-helix domain-containing protein, partial [Roseimicrobium sp.]|nr:winged helix-turn-helix domain-containing protein [Roseimicrobium sp.]